MADEKAPDAPPAPAEAAPAKEGAAPGAPGTMDAVEGAQTKKPSLIQKLLGNKLVMMIGTAVLGLLLGVVVMSFIGGGKKKEDKKAAPAKKEAAAAEKAEKSEKSPEKSEEHGAEKKEEGEAPKAEKKEEGAAPEAKSEEGKAEGGKAEGDKGEAGKEGEAGGTEPVLFKFEPVVVNVVEKNSLHYLKLQMVTECTTTEVVEEIKLKTPQLRDSLLFLINDMTLREILTSGGKALLKEDIVATFNKVLKKGEVKRVFFTDFTIQ